MASDTSCIRRMHKVMINNNNNEQLPFHSCFYCICSLLTDVSKCLLFIFLLYLSHSCFSVPYIFIYNTKILRMLLQFVFNVQCHHLFQVFVYFCGLGSYWILFVFMFRMLLPHFMAVGLLGWEDVLPYASLSLPSLFCIHLLGHPKCF